MGKRRDHICECEYQPFCFRHDAREWGGDEPDVCEPHDDLTDPAEQRAAMAIIEAIGGLDALDQGRVVRFHQWRAASTDTPE
jgi:hypothetical protein